MSQCGRIRTGKPESKVNNFPVTLHYVLGEMEKDGQSHVMSWLPHGRSFIVHQPEKLQDEILPTWFRQTKFSSFQRQLNIYGFIRVPRGPERGSYFHPRFLKGMPELACTIPREHIKKRNTNNAATHDKTTGGANTQIPARSPAIVSVQSSGRVLLPASGTTKTSPIRTALSLLHDVTPNLPTTAASLYQNCNTIDSPSQLPSTDSGFVAHRSFRLSPGDVTPIANYLRQQQHQTAPSPTYQPSNEIKIDHGDVGLLPMGMAGGLVSNHVALQQSLSPATRHLLRQHLAQQLQLFQQQERERELRQLLAAKRRIAD